MNHLVYAISNGRQGFFSIHTGKYVPVTKKQFKYWTKQKQKWWYTLGLYTQNGPQQLIELPATYRWEDKITPHEHFERTKEIYKEVLDSRDDVIDVLHLIYYPITPEPSEEAIQRILQILQGEHDKQS